MASNMSRQQCVYMAKIAEETEQYKDMAKYMSKIVTDSAPAEDLTLEERALFSIAYKSVVGSIRAAWRVASSNEQKDLRQAYQNRAQTARDYGSALQLQMDEVCGGVLELLDSRLIPAAANSEAKVFYLKMKGDYYRYLAELKIGNERNEATEHAAQAYKVAEDIAVVELSPTHPTRLALALNLSVFYFEILNSLDLACCIAKEAYEEAMGEIDNEEAYKDGTLIMQLMKDNLMLWTSDTDVNNYYS